MKLPDLRSLRWCPAPAVGNDEPMEAPVTLRDPEVAAYIASLGLPGIIDVHTRFMPGRVQAKMWAHFDRLDPPWRILYRAGEAERLAILARLAVRHHTALAYAHRPGMAAWLNEHTLGLAATHPEVVGSFTFYPEPGVDAEVERALTAGGVVAKVHLQVGKFHALDPLLDAVWPLLATGAACRSCSTPARWPTVPAARSSAGPGKSRT
jgi:uncharacterized protein